MTETTSPRHQGGSESQTDPAANASSNAAGPALASVEKTAEKVLPILPKGFVENTVEIYADVASYSVLPPEKLREYWRVYTTTNRRLCDPTAKRLESFWWHVWGSKLRYSSGDTLAKLYENISTGPTIVPLRGPANRYEPPTPPPALIKKQAPSHAETRKSSHKPNPNQVDLSNSSTAAFSEDRDRMYDGGTKNRSDNTAADDVEVAQQGIDMTATADHEDQPQVPVKVLSSSASRPPPAQSILRKPRSSLTGSRPTPRFTLPADIPTQDELDAHASGGTEDIVGSGSLASGSGSASSGLAEPSPSSAGSSRSGPRKQARTKPTKKKFVAASSKRKAFVLKRSGSQVLTAASDTFGPQETRRLQSPKSPLSEHPMSGGIIEEIILLPPEPEDPVLSVPPEDESKGRQSQQYRSPQQGPSSPPMHETDTTEKQSTPPEGLPTTRRSAARLPDLQGIDRHFPDAASMAVPETRSGHRNPESTAPPMFRRTASSVGTPAMEISMGSRETLGRPSCRLIRQMTLPQGIGQIAAPTSAARSFPDSSTSLEAATSRPSTPGAGSFVAPMLSRSTSQDGSAFWSRRSGESVSSPTGMGAAALATPSMVAARGVFSDADGPDPFRMYATTGLKDHLDDDDDDQQEHSFHPERSSFSYTDPNPLHRPLFTPTRPSPTPRIPFARTRSQLNVILDREKARLGQGTFASWQESRTGRDSSESSRGASHRTQDGDQIGSSAQ